MSNTTLKHPKSGRTITVPADTADFYTKHGWVVPGKAEETPQESAPVVVPEGEPAEAWKNAEIAAYAERESIDLGGATVKADMLAAIADARKQEPSGSDTE